ncbi:hypothetical protein MS3_00001681 [Schistosoma haematobium]|uniref:Zinc finger and BTB domain-containing protein 48 n=1 Tax=Schistosoma haematobium TaxID=6185 RepID=A0A094ZU87_SCHHA|nr:hypothetical protein MS3_00001681 [Schistosoma haematobium]KAH9595745.1 hypothetical protein MS3_00001681 [Schistosoma haematobium]CAH8471389.1 unnamed protein product [Schistosoma haematobium]CAH8472608.1 unnamed protein product [Schistosoma haematobium]
MEEEGELNKGPLDNSLASSCQNDITESLMTQPIPINIRIAQDIQEFLCKGSKSFKCSLCTRTFRRRDKIKRHLIECHYGIKDYECSLCFKKFARNEHYNRHMNDVHTLTKGYHCRLCNRRFKRNSEFCHHIKTAHHEQSGLFASGSVLLFNQSEDTINNNNDHSTSNHLSHNYEQQQSLQIDQVDSNSIDVAGPGLYVEVEFNADKTEVGKNPKPFECTLCGKPFSRQDKLRRHYQEAHDGIREEHQCPACEKRFYRKYHLNRHIAEVHRAGKPFLCPYCRREFAREWSYHQHLQKYHDDCVNSAPVTCIENLEG